MSTNGWTSTGEQRMDTSTMGTTVDGALSVTMSRRRVLRLLGAAGTTAVLAGAARATPASAAQQLRTLSSLNLRAKPRADARVLRVMPEGATVTRIPGGAGRYVKVVYDGTRGYAHLDFLDDAADQGGGGGEAPGGGGEAGEIVGLTSTTTDVNLRSGPSTGAAVIRVLDPGAVVNYTFTIENGFRQVEHNGRWGWVWDAFLDFQAGPERRVTTTAVNLRATPSTGAKVLAVVPEGAIVGDQEESANGFRKVSYKGAIGWCWADYISS